MTNSPATPSRDERLAAKLRENLHRRKAQSRAAEPGPAAAPDDSPDRAEVSPDLSNLSPGLSNLSKDPPTR